MKCTKCGYESIAHFQTCPNCSYDVFDGKYQDQQKAQSALSRANQLKKSTDKPSTSGNSLADSESEIKIMFGTSFVFTLAGWLSLIYSLYLLVSNKDIGGLSAVFLIPVALIIILLGYISMLLVMNQRSLQNMARGD